MTERLTKTDQVRTLFLEGSLPSITKAIGMMGRFKLSLTKDESRALQITHEVLTGHSSFYAQLGVEIDKEKSIVMGVIKRMYGFDVIL